MAISPTTEILFCNVPWASDYKFICDGATSSTIAATSIKTLTNYSYQRKDSVIKAGCLIDDVIGANYVMYKNASYENKWFYAFIESIEYVSDALTLVKIKTDAYMTWKSDFSLGRCFVQREHVTDDTLGLHNIPEGLEAGEMVNADYNNVGLNISKIIVATTINYPSLTDSDVGGIYHGQFSGCNFYSFAHDDWNGINALITLFVQQSQKDAILAIFTQPSIIIADRTGKLGATYACGTITHNAPARPATIDGYTPKNNKLFVYPYCYLYGYNNMGSSGIYRYEEYSAVPQFQVVGNIGPNCQVKVFPINKRTNDNIEEEYQYTDEGLTIGGWPLCLWTWDTFDAYNAAQGGSIAAGFAGSALALTTGLATGNPVAIAGGAIGAFASLASYAEKGRQPPQASGAASSGAVNMTFALQDIFFYAKTIRAEYARQIDEYFSMYGYKVNRVKTPALTGRAQWNYIQCNDALVKGGIPEDDKKALTNMLNNGVTIWHNQANIGDYSLANGVT